MAKRNRRKANTKALQDELKKHLKDKDGKIDSKKLDSKEDMFVNRIIQSIIEEIQGSFDLDNVKRVTVYISEIDAKNVFGKPYGYHEERGHITHPKTQHKLKMNITSHSSIKKGQWLNGWMD